MFTYAFKIRVNMAAYLIVDVDDLLQHFRLRGTPMDAQAVQELAVGLRAGAALVSGLASFDKLRAIAAANWQNHVDTPSRGRPVADARYIFKTAGYDLFDAEQEGLVEGLITTYFANDPEPIDELILATTSPELINLIRRVKLPRRARIRMWGAENILEGTEFAEEVIFQPLNTLLGIQQTKNVAIYIDFENIAISLNEQGYTVNLDQLIESFQRQGKAHGQIVKIAAYAPWGQRGSLPPLVDQTGREVADDAPSRLAMANIDPVFNLPGKNSADMRIAKDVITDSSHSDSADVYIVASGDRDFNDAIQQLRRRNKTVILWAVRGSVSRQLESNPNIIIEYVEDFTNLQTHQMLHFASLNAAESSDVMGFTPSQWSSVILQFDRMTQTATTKTVTRNKLIEQLLDVGAVVSKARGEDLVTQAISLGILLQSSATRLSLDETHPVVDKTRLIRDRVVVRVLNTLTVRDWEYVNYGFLLKGLSMERDLDLPGMNYSDQWRSDWIDCLVREHILQRDLVPHRHNPDDLVPVIKLRDDYEVPTVEDLASQQPIRESWGGITLDELERMEPETADMVRRVIVSVDQFTSFRGFTWCPLGSLHKRLRNFDRGMSFQRSVEYISENGGAVVQEYPNPQSEFFTKGISLLRNSEMTLTILEERDTFIHVLLALYTQNIAITEQSLMSLDPKRQNLGLWISIMETENILNPVPGRPGQYSLFRTHHSVSLVADKDDENKK